MLITVPISRDILLQSSISHLSPNWSILQPRYCLTASMKEWIGDKVYGFCLSSSACSDLRLVFIRKLWVDDRVGVNKQLDHRVNFPQVRVDKINSPDWCQAIMVDLPQIWSLQSFIFSWWQYDGIDTQIFKNVLWHFIRQHKLHHTVFVWLRCNCSLLAVCCNSLVCTSLLLFWIARSWPSTCKVITKSPTRKQSTWPCWFGTWSTVTTQDLWMNLGKLPACVKSLCASMSGRLISILFNVHPHGDGIRAFLE